MHLYKHFFKLIGRNVSGLIIYGMITLVMIAILGLQAKSSGNTMGVSAATVSRSISYADNDNSALSKGLIDFLSVNNKVTDYSGRSETEISNIVFFAMTDYHFTIPEGMENEVEAGNTNLNISFETANGASGYMAYEMSNLIDGYLNTYRNFRNIGLSETEAISRTKNVMINDTRLTVISDEEENAGNNTKEIVLFNINQYFPYILLGMLALGIGNTILITSKKELEDRNCVSPIPTYMTRLTNTVGLITVGLVLWAALMAFNFIYGAGTDMIRDYGWVIAVNSFLCMLIDCAMASLMTALIKSSNALSMVTNIVGLGMSFLCGVFVPIRFIGEKVVAFAKFLPFYWTVTVNNMTNISQSKYAFDSKLMIMSFVVEFLFAIAISTIAIISGNKCIIKE